MGGLLSKTGAGNDRSFSVASRKRERVRGVPHFRKERKDSSQPLTHSLTHPTPSFLPSPPSLSTAAVPTPSEACWYGASEKKRSEFRESFLVLRGRERERDKERTPKTHAPHHHQNPKIRRGRGCWGGYGYRYGYYGGGGCYGGCCRCGRKLMSRFLGGGNEEQ